VLRPLATASDPNIIIGLQTSDDAAVYRLSDEQALVQTVDFFPPVVDDPYVYGAIAAANSLSDIFAMGGEALFALNIAAFPESLPLEILSRIFEGGADKALEAGIVIAGGHTVVDVEPKYGLVVTGTVHPKRILTKAAARPGDRLFLTKPLGSGVITTAIKQQAATEADTCAAIESMLQLNLTASRVARDIVHAATDITGYGLLGHASEMAAKSGVALELHSAVTPWLPGALRYAAERRFPGGAQRNRAHYEHDVECGVTFDAAVPRDVQRLLFSPETSGGLLLSAPMARGDELLAGARAAGLEIWEIGVVREGRGIHVR
jgi:selenide,water dikinase